MNRYPTGNHKADDMKETQAEYDRRDTTDREIEYAAANGHLLVYCEDANRPGKPARAAAGAAWHSPRCGCGGERLPDW
jgi:hypothetical protein